MTVAVEKRQKLVCYIGCDRRLAAKVVGVCNVYVVSDPNVLISRADYGFACRGGRKQTRWKTWKFKGATGSERCLYQRQRFRAIVSSRYKSLKISVLKRHRVSAGIGKGDRLGLLARKFSANAEAYP